MKKEIDGQLKLVRAIPATGKGDVAVLPPMKNMSHVKVGFVFRVHAVAIND